MHRPTVILFTAFALQLDPNSSMARYEMAMWKSTAGEYKRGPGFREANER